MKISEEIAPLIEDGYELNSEYRFDPTDHPVLYAKTLYFVFTKEGEDEVLYSYDYNTKEWLDVDGIVFECDVLEHK